MLEGEGDAFWFHLKRKMPNKSPRRPLDRRSSTYISPQERERE
jgi:hypothetical protein